MVIIQKLIQVLGILPGHGIGADGTMLQGLLQSGLFFINSFCSSTGNPQIKDQAQHGKDKYRQKASDLPPDPSAGWFK